MDGKLSNVASHKLRAAICSIRPDLADLVPAEYVDACQDWYGALSVSDRMLATLAVVTFEKGVVSGAETMVSGLPPAPMLPMG